MYNEWDIYFRPFKDWVFELIMINKISKDRKTVNTTEHNSFKDWSITIEQKTKLLSTLIKKISKEEYIKTEIQKEIWMYNIKKWDLFPVVIDDYAQDCELLQIDENVAILRLIDFEWDDDIYKQVTIAELEVAIEEAQYELEDISEEDEFYIKMKICLENMKR